MRNRGKRTKHRLRHISTLRQERRKGLPGPLFLLFLALLAFAIGLLLDGCEQAPGSKDTGTIGTANTLRDQANVRSLENAIQHFREMQGENPRSIDELIENGLLEEMPVASPGHRYAYDPASGVVSIESGPSSPGSREQPTSGDGLVGVLDAALNAKSKADLKKIKTSIAVYQAQEGRYPESLEVLVQSDLLERLPKPPSGMTYHYDGKSGKVTLVKSE